MCTQAGRGWSVRMRARLALRPLGDTEIATRKSISKTFSFMERAVI